MPRNRSSRTNGVDASRDTTKNDDPARRGLFAPCSIVGAIAMAILNSLVESRLQSTRQMERGSEDRLLVNGRHSTSTAARQIGQTDLNIGALTPLDVSRDPRVAFFTLHSGANSDEISGFTSHRILRVTRCINESVIHSPSAMRSDVSAIEAGARSDVRVGNRARLHPQRCDALCCKYRKLFLSYAFVTRLTG